MARDWNSNVIEEFRTNEGRVGGPFEGRSILLLHHRGAKTGTERVSPLAYRRTGNAYAVFASKGGSSTNPDWYHNVIANPQVRVEVGTDVIDVMAREATGAEREQIWEDVIQEMPAFADYQLRSGRTIPVIVLDPVD